MLPRRRSANRTTRQPRYGSNHDALAAAAGVTLAEKLNALTAAAVKVRSDNAGAMRRLIQPWQILTLAYYDQVGECWAPANFYGRSLKKVRLFAGERDVDGEIQESSNPAAQEIVSRIQDPGGGGYTQLLESYGRLKFLTGEGYFLVTNPEEDDERWEFVSPDELRINSSGGYTRFVAPSLPSEELAAVDDDDYEPIGDQALVYRVWRPHPRFSRLADSAIRAQLKTLEELQLLSLAIGATAKNRMAVNGLLYVPESIADEPVDPSNDEDPHHQTFLRDLTEQIVSPIVNPGTAAAAAPVILVGPDTSGELIKWIQISDPTQNYPEEGIRTELIRRFAVGIDLPAEILTGTADVNHWGSWLIDEQYARDYVFPVCEELVTELTSIFLRPILKEQGEPDFERYVVGYDGDAVIAHPNRAADAKDAHDRITISDAVFRDALNFNDKDAPDEEEWQRRAALKMNDQSALTDPYVDTAVPADEDQEAGVEDAPEGNSDVSQGTPDTQPDGNNSDKAVLAALLAGACQMAVVRSRELAGAKLRRLANGESSDVENHDLAAVLGADWVRQRGSESSLVEGGTRPLTVTLTGMGLDGLTADRVAGMVATHAARTLCRKQPGPLPAGLAAYLEQIAARQ